MKEYDDNNDDWQDEAEDINQAEGSEWDSDATQADTNTSLDEGEADRYDLTDVGPDYS